MANPKLWDLGWPLGLEIQPDPCSAFLATDQPWCQKWTPAVSDVKTIRQAKETMILSGDLTQIGKK